MARISAIDQAALTYQQQAYPDTVVRAMIVTDPDQLEWERLEEAFGRSTNDPINPVDNVNIAWHVSPGSGGSLENAQADFVNALIETTDHPFIDAETRTTAANYGTTGAYFNMGQQGADLSYYFQYNPEQAPLTLNGIDPTIPTYNVLSPGNVAFQVYSADELAIFASSITPQVLPSPVAFQAASTATIDQGGKA